MTDPAAPTIRERWRRPSLQTTVDPDTRHRLQLYMARYGLSEAAVIRAAVHEFLHQHTDEGTHP